jgi:hypothetical protein
MGRKDKSEPKVLTKVVRNTPQSRQVRSLLEDGWVIVASRGGHLLNVPTLTLTKTVEK